MEKHDRAAVTIFQAVGNTGDSVDGNQVINLIAALTDRGCKIIDGLGAVTVSPYY